jgi:hypothetical protein
MGDVEVGRRVTNLVAVLARMNGKVGERDLDALQECLRLAESVPGIREGLVQVRLAEAAVREALRKYGRHGDDCGGSRACTCGLGLAVDVDTGAGPARLPGAAADPGHGGQAVRGAGPRGPLGRRGKGGTLGGGTPGAAAAAGGRRADWICLTSGGRSRFWGANRGATLALRAQHE